MQVLFLDSRSEVLTSSSGNSQSLESLIDTLNLQLLLRKSSNGGQDVKEATIFCIDQILKLKSSTPQSSRQLPGLFETLIKLIISPGESSSVIQFAIRSIGDLCLKGQLSSRSSRSSLTRPHQFSLCTGMRRQIEEILYLFIVAPSQKPQYNRRTTHNRVVHISACATM